MAPSKTTYVVGCLNIHLTVKEKREELINFISSRADVDILGICETWFKPDLGKEVMGESLQNSEYEWYGLDRKKQTTKQGDGGVGFLIRKRVGKIEVAKSHLENDILWIKIAFGSSCLFLCIVYISPYGTPRDVDTTQQLIELEKDILMFQRKGRVMVMGDFNHRIGNIESRILRNGQVTRFQRTTKDINIPPFLKQRGQVFVDMMNTSHMIILNGLDSDGDLTSYQHNGNAVVDYLVVSCEMYDQNLVRSSENKEKEEDDEDEDGEEEEIKKKISFTTQGRMIPSKEEILYKPKSTKVWSEFEAVLSDHRMITCEIETPEKPQEIVREQKSEVKSQQKKNDLQERKTNKWKRRDHGDPTFWEPFIREVDLVMPQWMREVNLRMEGKDDSRYCDWLNESFLSSLNRACQKGLGVIKPRKIKTKIFVRNQEISQMKQEEKEAYDVWQAGDDEKKEELWKKYRQISKKRKKKIKQHKKEQEEKIVVEIENLKSKDPKEYWKKLKQLANSQKKKENLPQEMKNKNNQLVTGQEMLTVWAEAFASLGQEGNNNYDDVFRDETAAIVKLIEHNRSEEVGPDQLENKIELEEIKAAIKLLRRGKAVGIDGMFNEAFKYGGEKLIEATLKLFQEIWEKDERFPTQWSRGLIFPLFKGGPKEFTYDPLKYRGITLLSVVGKLYTTILNQRIMNWCESKDVLVEEQAGFRKNRSTIDQLFILHEIVNTRKPNKTYCCFIDIQKAYDRVWRDGLWKLLYKYGIKGKMWRVIKNIYEKVESSVLVNEFQTEFFEVVVGLRQGCVLSPVLFSIFINELAEKIKNLGKGIKMGRSKVCILLFADDIVIIAESKEELQMMMNATFELSRKWRFNFNFDKCAVMIFEDSKVSETPYQYGPCKGECKCGKHWKFGDHLIVETQMYKYLGVELDKKMSFKDFKIRVAEKAKKNRAKVWRMGMNTGALSVKASINLWDALCRSNLEYAAEIWGRQKWDEAENIMMEMGRRILRCHGKTTGLAILGELGWWTMQTRREYIMLKYWINIVLMADTRLVKKIYHCSKQKYLLNPISQKNSLTAQFHVLIKKYHLDLLWLDEKRILNPERQQGQDQPFDVRNYWKEQLRKIVHAKEEQTWINLMKLRPKLRTYRIIKDKLELEKYLLSPTNKTGRSLLIGLRTGTNRLRIETGRHKKEDKKERLCMVCMSGEIEDEKHFVLGCTAYNTYRTSMFDHIATDTNEKMVLNRQPIDVQWVNLFKGPNLTNREKNVVSEHLKIFLVLANKRRKINLEPPKI